MSVPAVLNCTACTREWTLERPPFRCPTCGSRDVEVVAGNELEVESIDGRRGGSMHRTKVKVLEGVLDANDTIAQANRADFDAAGVTVVNLMSAPGAGKTSLLEAVLETMEDVRVGVLEGDVRGTQDAERIAALHTPRRAHPGRADQHGSGVRGRVPPRREHGAIGAAVAAARRARPARDRERRQPRLPGGVPHRRGRPRDGLVGDRGRGQAPQVPAHVPGVRPRRRQQDRPRPAPRLRPRRAARRTSTTCIPASSGSSSARRPARASPTWRTGSPKRRQASGRSPCERRRTPSGRADAGRAPRTARGGDERAFFGAEAERIARLCHSMAERFSSGGRLLALGGDAAGALGCTPRRRRVRAPRHRGEARAARARADGGGRRLSSARRPSSASPPTWRSRSTARRARTSPRRWPSPGRAAA